MSIILTILKRDILFGTISSERKPYKEWAVTKKVNVFVFCLQPRKYGFHDYSAIEEKYHTNYKHIQLRTSYLCTTETTDPVQWIEQLYNEDVS